MGLLASKIRAADSATVPDERVNIDFRHHSAAFRRIGRALAWAIVLLEGCPRTVLAWVLALRRP